MSSLQTHIEFPEEIIGLAYNHPLLQNLNDPFYGGKEFENQGEFMQEILELLMDLKGRVAVVIDGLPGSGKSSFSELLLSVLRKVNCPHVSTSVDLFIKQKETEKERLINLFRSDEDFLRLYCDFDKVRSLAERALNAPAGDIEVQGAYNRETRGYEDIQIEIPESELGRWVVVEGVNALGITKELKDAGKCDHILPIAISTDPRIALIRKTQRNIKLGRVNVADREGMLNTLDTEAQDIAHVARLILEPTLKSWGKINVLKW